MQPLDGVTVSQRVGEPARWTIPGVSQPVYFWPDIQTSPTPQVGDLMVWRSMYTYRISDSEINTAIAPTDLSREIEKKAFRKAVLQPDFPPDWRPLREVTHPEVVVEDNLGGFDPLLRYANIRASTCWLCRYVGLDDDQS